MEHELFINSVVKTFKNLLTTLAKQQTSEDLKLRGRFNRLFPELSELKFDVSDGEKQFKHYDYVWNLEKGNGKIVKVYWEGHKMEEVEEKEVEKKGRVILIFEKFQSLFSPFIGAINPSKWCL